LLVRNQGLRLDPIGPAEIFGHKEWIENSVSLRTFPDELKLDTPEWSGMDGFFAARLVRSE
jgi:16S rRNA (cytosine967-C5)-methyltransferase